MVWLTQSALIICAVIAIIDDNEFALRRRGDRDERKRLLPDYTS